MKANASRQCRRPVGETAKVLGFRLWPIQLGQQCVCGGHRRICRIDASLESGSRCLDARNVITGLGECIP